MAHRKNRGFAFFSLSLVCLVLTLSSCHTKIEERERNKITINFQDGDLPSTHPHIGIDYRIRSLQSALFEGLTRMDASGQPQPAMAETISISPNQTEYTFKLREALWSNGEPVTASHFAEAWRRAMAKNSPCRRADLFYIIKNGENIKKGISDLNTAGIKVMDAKTLHVELEHPAPYFLELISNPIFSPIYNLSQEEPNVYNGPFVLHSWKHDDLITLRKNPLYWDKKNVQLEKIDILVVTDPLTAVQLYEKGEIDWIGSPFSCLPTDLIPSFQKLGILQSKEVARIYWLYCNHDSWPFNHPLIRKALSLAIDRKAIGEHVLLGQNPATTPLPRSLTRLSDQPLSETANAPQAQELFAQALHELNVTQEDFPPITLSHSHITGQRQLAEIIQNDWQKNLGIRVHLKGSEWNVFFSDLSQGNYEIGGCIKSALFRDPISHLELLREKTHPYNVSRWEDVTYQNLLKEAQCTTDNALRDHLLKEAEHILLTQMPVIPIYSETYLYVLRSSIQGIIIHDLGHVDFKWAKVE